MKPTTQHKLTLGFAVLGLIAGVTLLVGDDLGYVNLKSRDYLITISGVCATTLGLKREPQ